MEAKPGWQAFDLEEEVEEAVSITATLLSRDKFGSRKHRSREL